MFRGLSRKHLLDYSALNAYRESRDLTSFCNINDLYSALPYCILNFKSISVPSYSNLPYVSRHKIGDYHCKQHSRFHQRLERKTEDPPRVSSLPRHGHKIGGYHCKQRSRFHQRLARKTEGPLRVPVAQRGGRMTDGHRKRHFEYRQRCEYIALQ